MRSLLKLAALIVLVVAWFLTFHPASLGGRASYVMVSGTSMQPTLYTNDLVITRTQPTYAVGDIVAYRVDDSQVIHRIVGGSNSEGYLLQGDNNPSVDPWYVTDNEIVGKSWVRIPGGAVYLRALQGPGPLAAVLVFFMTIGTLLQSGVRRGRVSPAPVFVVRAP